MGLIRLWLGTNATFIGFPSQMFRGPLFVRMLSQVPSQHTHTHTDTRFASWNAIGNSISNMYATQNIPILTYFGTRSPSMYKKRNKEEMFVEFLGVHAMQRLQNRRLIIKWWKKSSGTVRCCSTTTTLTGNYVQIKIERDRQKASASDQMCESKSERDRESKVWRRRPNGTSEIAQNFVCCLYFIAAAAISAVYSRYTKSAIVFAELEKNLHLRFVPYFWLVSSISINFEH